MAAAMPDTPAPITAQVLFFSFSIILRWGQNYLFSGI
jgi:hypothetical protein